MNKSFGLVKLWRYRLWPHNPQSLCRKCP